MLQICCRDFGRRNQDISLQLVADHRRSAPPAPVIKGGAAHNPPQARDALRLSAAFFMPSSSLQASLGACFGHEKAPSICLGLGVGWRSEADYRRSAPPAPVIKGGAAHNPPQARDALRLSAAFFMPSSSLQASLGACFGHEKAPSICLGLGVGWRSEADSNRCSSFCRAEPSHSAIGPAC